jgi:hypothetical protein
MDPRASQALDEWSDAIEMLVVAIAARETAERFHADALAARHPFKSRIARTYTRLVSAIIRQEAAEEAEAAARRRFERIGGVPAAPPLETLPAPRLVHDMPGQRG